MVTSETASNGGAVSPSKMQFNSLFQVPNGFFASGTETGHIHVQTLGHKKLIFAINTVGHRLHGHNLSPFNWVLKIHGLADQGRTVTAAVTSTCRLKTCDTADWKVCATREAQLLRSFSVVYTLVIRATALALFSPVNLRIALSYEKSFRCPALLRCAVTETTIEWFRC